MNLLRNILMLLVRGYQKLVSPLLTALFGPMGMGCRFTPTCSQYALEALRDHGACRGSWLTLRRLFRCHPWGSAGLDPVPPPHRPRPHHSVSNRHPMTSLKSCRHGS